MKEGKVMVIGHVPEGLPAQYEVVVQKSIQFATTSREVILQLNEIVHDATSAGVDVVLLQDVPGQLTAALVFFAHYDAILSMGGLLQWGVICSKPDPHPAAVSQTVVFETRLDAVNAAFLAEVANSKAKVHVSNDTVRVEVVPPAQPTFDHIEWL